MPVSLRLRFLGGLSGANCVLFVSFALLCRVSRLNMARDRSYDVPPIRERQRRHQSFATFSLTKLEQSHSSLPCSIPSMNAFQFLRASLDPRPRFAQRFPPRTLTLSFHLLKWSHLLMPHRTQRDQEPRGPSEKKAGGCPGVRPRPTASWLHFFKRRVCSACLPPANKADFDLFCTICEANSCEPIV